MDFSTNRHTSVGRSYGDLDNCKDLETGLTDPDTWKFTPSMDTNSFAFANFANQHSAGFTPTPGGTNPLFHNQAGDLHTPGMGFQLGTPLSSGDSHPTSAIDVQGFNAHLLHSHQYQTSSDFQEQQSFAPSTFMHRDSGYDTMDQTNNGLPLQEVNNQREADKNPDFAAFPSREYDHMQPSATLSMEKYAFQPPMLDDFADLYA